MKTPKKLLCLLLVAIMAIGVIPFASAKVASEYTDIGDVRPNSLEALYVLTALGIVEGFEEGNFGPDGTFTRAQAAAIVARMLIGASATRLPSAVTGFSDVPADHWASGPIAYCVAQGIIKGYGDGRFGPSDSVTDLQFAAMLLRAIGKSGYEGAGWEMRVFNDATGGVTDLGLLTTEKDLTTAAKREFVVVYAFKALIYSSNSEKKTSTKYVVTAVGAGLHPLLTVNGFSYDTFAAAMTAATGAGGSGSPVYGIDFTINSMSVSETKAVGSIGDKVFGLKKNEVDEEDAFGRPSLTTWIYKNAPIYRAVTVEPVLTYKTSVSYATIFNDLGFSGTTATSTSIIPTYVDGFATGSSIIAHNDTKFLPDSGNGVLTEIYKISDTSYRIVIINTYIGTVGDPVAATAIAKAYVSIDAATGTSPAGTSPAGAVLTDNGKFETTGLSKGDVVLYTAATTAKGGTQYAVKSAKVASTIETVPTYQNASSFIGDGTTYRYTKYHSGAIASSDVTTKAEKVVYLDDYGYAIKIDKPAGSASNFAVVLATHTTDADTWSSTSAKYEARLLYSDGTVKDVPINANDFWTVHHPVTPGANTGTGGDIVIYGSGSAGTTSLTQPNPTGPTNPLTYAVGGRPVVPTPTTPIAINNGAITFNAGININKPNDNTFRADRSTIFFIETVNAATGARTYKVYVGMLNVPKITDGAKSAVWCNTAPDATGFAQAVFVSDAKVTPTGTPSTDVYYVSLEYKSDATDERGEFTSYFAVVNGETEVIEATKDHFQDDRLLGTVFKNDDGLIFDEVNLTSNGTVVPLQKAVGTTAAAYGVVKLGATEYAYRDETLVFYITPTGITKSPTGVASIATHPNDLVSYYTTGNVLTAIYISVK
ncbi:MAG: S-layer homology domain-containing protein [Oscillospiraceae bacterium]|jgi:hypothetical protein|nr:S-layer homology domain-containing protein [Oscillospiraceae bacterium]